MKNKLIYAALATGLMLLTLARSAHAQITCFPKDAVISRDMPKEINIGYANMTDQAGLKTAPVPL